MILPRLKFIHIVLLFLKILSRRYLLVSSQTSQNINVLFINELDNDPASKAIDIVQTYLKKNSNYGLSVQIDKIEANKTDAKALLESICIKYAESIENKQPPHVVFDTTKSGIASETVKSFTQALGLPTVSASYGQEGDLRQWRDMEESKQKYLLQVMPPADIIPEVVRSIVRKMNITNAAILYDNTFVMDHKYKSLLQNIQTRHVITAVAEGDSARADQIERLRNLDINNFFILGSLKTIGQVLESVKPAFFERNFAWHAITQNEGEVSSKRDNATIMFLKPIVYTQNRERLGQLRTTYNLNEEPQIMSVFYFDLALRTFLAVKDMLQSGAWPANMEYLGCDDFQGGNTPERNIDLRQAFVQVTEPASYGDFDLVTQPGKPFNGYSFFKFDMDVNVVQIRGGNSVNSKSIGRWTAGLDSPLVVNDEEAMKNLTADTVYRIFTVVQAPFIMRDETAPKGYKGYCIDLINEIAEIVHFDYTIEEVEDGKFGNMDEKGEWNGIVKKLIDKKADIGLGSMSVMAEREIVIDFTVPYYDLVGITIMMQRPSTPSSLFKFLTVLETNVWLCILAAYFFTSFLMWVFDRWSPYSYQNNREKYKDDDEKREFNLKECLWFCMTSLTPQGGGEAPKNLSGRLVAATWWLFGFIIIASYTANLAAFLTVSRLDTPVESLDDLAKQYKILYAPLNGSSAMVYFERMANIEQMFYEIWKDLSLNDSLSPLERSRLAVWDYPVSDKYTKMWQAMQEAQLPATLDEAVARVRNSTTATGFAFLGDATDIRYLVMTNCDLQVVGEEFSRKPYAIAVQQGSHLKDQFNNAILTLLNKRQLEKLKEKWWKNDEAQSKCDKPEDQSDGISIENIGGVFIVIFVGIGMACITLVFEYWWYKYRKNPRIIDVAEAASTPPGKDVKLAEGIILGQTGKEYEKANAALRPRFNQYPHNFKPRF
ncbi:glutamate receptor ionotropic, kainate 4-like precursor [Musca domestica]|uniref:Glutamate receptor ionotropic, kainate 4-like precursor n=1 Tax=Musca domestica TaxID=7370 RepID=J7H936_MUSDO|nr:glutamate receptor ionotropic, kainate 4-like precursor [Musca domestica]AFP89966.1 ionotropic receptor 25a [Musca domestica]